MNIIKIKKIMIAIFLAYFFLEQNTLASVRVYDCYSLRIIMSTIVEFWSTNKQKQKEQWETVFYYCFSFYRKCTACHSRFLEHSIKDQNEFLYEAIVSLQRKNSSASFLFVLPLNGNSTQS